jgi:septum formation protein
MSTHHPLWRGTQPLVLASSSAARRTLLASAGVPADIMPANVDERAIETRLAAQRTGPADLAIGLASAKALEVSRRSGRRWVIGGDQILTLEPGRQRFHKPETFANAARQLGELAGQTHQLTSAAALAYDGAIIGTCANHARLTMRTLRADQINTYLVAAGEGILASVGGYHIEGLGVHLFEKIEGDHFTIQGMPMLGLLKLLRDQELLA